MKYVSCLLLGLMACAPVQKEPPPLLEKTVKHVFSDPQQADTFRLTFEGDDLLTSKMTFEIVSHAGKRLYIDSQPARAFLGYGVLKYGENPTDEQKRTHIKARANTFFAPGQFTQPAIPKGATLELESPNPEYWKAIQALPFSVGFSYLTYEENSQWIAYLPDQKKAVVYQVCC